MIFSAKRAAKLVILHFAIANAAMFLQLQFFWDAMWKRIAARRANKQKNESQGPMGRIHRSPSCIHGGAASWSDCHNSPRCPAQLCNTADITYDKPRSKNLPPREQRFRSVTSRPLLLDRDKLYLVSIVNPR